MYAERENYGGFKTWQRRYSNVEVPTQLLLGFICNSMQHFIFNYSKVQEEGEKFFLFPFSNQTHFFPLIPTDSTFFRLSYDVDSENEIRQKLTALDSSCQGALLSTHNHSVGWIRVKGPLLVFHSMTNGCCIKSGWGES